MSIDQRIRDGLRSTNDQLSAPDIDRALAAVTAGGRSTHRRNLIAGLAAAAAVVLVIVGVLAATRDGSQRPIGPSTPTEKTTDTTGPASPMVNGRIQSADEYLAGVRSPCDSCEGADVIAFDQVTGRLLLAWPDPTFRHFERLRVVGREDQPAELTCPEDFGCAQETAALLATFGPGADELSVEVAEKEIQVVGYDGAVRRTVDLSAALSDETVYGLAWSPDGSRLAVTTRAAAVTGTGFVANIWLVDPDGGEAQLVHTATYTETLPEGNDHLAYVGSLVWSPDGSRLGFIEEHERGRPSGLVESQSIQAVSLLLPEPGQEGPGAVRTLYDYASLPYWQADFTWSPDGTRVAVRVPGQVLELSADDGSVLARHPFVVGADPTETLPPLVWPESQS